MGSNKATKQTVTLWPVENNAATCNGRMWIWTLGYHLFLDPIIAKSRRIAAIFDTKLQVR